MGLDVGQAVLPALSPTLLLHPRQKRIPNVTAGLHSAVRRLRECAIMRAAVLRTHAGRRLRKGVLVMDAQTVIAVCAIFTVVLAMVRLDRRK